MRIVAILASYNEERFIRPCLEHYFAQGIEVYMIDNESSDSTVEIAKGYLNKGLIGIETFRRLGVYSWHPLLKRKEQLANELKADWFIHADPDEIRLPPSSDMTLRSSLEYVDQQGYNAVNFFEFVFVPTLEEPHHNHDNYQKTMKWYYPFAPHHPHHLKAWKRQSAPVDLASSGGHLVAFDGIKPYPVDFKLKHYICLSVPHAISKYCNRQYDPTEIRMGWHGVRARVTAESVRLPSQSKLHRFVSDDLLENTNVSKQHLIFQE